MYTDEQIAEILELDEKRTQGEWSVCGHSKSTVCNCGYIFGSNGEAYLAKILNLDDGIDPVYNDAERMVNTLFIAKAPTMAAIIRQLLSEVDRLEGEVKKLHETLEYVEFSTHAVPATLAGEDIPEIIQQHWQDAMRLIRKAIKDYRND